MKRRLVRLERSKPSSCFGNLLEGLVQGSVCAKKFSPLFHLALECLLFVLRFEGAKASLLRCSSVAAAVQVVLVHAKRQLVPTKKLVQPSAFDCVGVGSTGPSWLAVSLYAKLAVLVRHCPNFVRPHVKESSVHRLLPLPSAPPFAKKVVSPCVWSDTLKSESLGRTVSSAVELECQVQVERVV